MGMKMKDDEQLEKLFEKMDRKTAIKIANQNSPKKAVTKKTTKGKK